MKQILCFGDSNTWGLVAGTMKRHSWNERWTGILQERLMNQDIRADFARQIRAIRQSQHLTQQVLADRVGTKKSNISRMESGRYNPSLDFMVRVAASMGKQVTITIEDE